MFVDCYGNTPLHHAVGVYDELKTFNIRDDVSEVVDYLVKHGADINAQNNAGLTPLLVAEADKAIKACLRHADDQSFMITDKQGRNFWHLLFILSSEHKCNILMAADILHMIPSLGAAVFGHDSLRRTPLHYACMREGCDRQEFTCNFINALNDDLIVNKQDEFGRTALHYALIVGNRQLVNLLATKKADMMIQDKFGKTAKDYVTMRDEFDTKVRLQSLTVISFADKRYHTVLVCIKRCFEERCSDSAKYEAELRKLIKDLRESVDITSFVRNIYQHCRFDYIDKFYRKKKLVRECLHEQDNIDTTDETNIRSPTTFAAIQKLVTKAMEYLANQISSEDDRFACEVVREGSAQEGTKIGCCDEFDYNFILTKLSRKSRIGYSPESPPGFVLLKASTPDYDEDLFNDNRTLNTRIVKFRFEALVEKVLSSLQFFEATNFVFVHPNGYNYLANENGMRKPHTCIKLTIIQPVNGCHVMHLISVDIVPALQINDWWPEDARRQDLCQTGECLIVFTQPQNKYPWIGWTEPHGFISFARAESRLLCECPQVVKAAYMVVKRMSKFFCHHEFFSSHVIKTALLWCLDEGSFSSCLQSSDSDEVNWDVLLCLVQKILRRLMSFAAQDYVPCYFMPKCHQTVWVDEKHLKQFHMRFHQHGLAYKDLFSLTELQSQDEVLKYMRSMFILSHVMYWTVFSDTDELELFAPSTINPLREISYQHVPMTFCRQLKTEVYNRSDY